MLPWTGVPSGVKIIACRKKPLSKQKRAFRGVLSPRNQDQIQLIIIWTHIRKDIRSLRTLYTLVFWPGRGYFQGYFPPVITLDRFNNIIGESIESEPTPRVQRRYQDWSFLFEKFLGKLTWWSEGISFLRGLERLFDCFWERGFRKTRRVPDVQLHMDGIVYSFVE